MKNIRLYILLALLLMAGGVTMQGQEYPYHLEEIRSTGDTVVFAMNYIDETTLLSLASKTNDDNKPVVFVQKMRDDGEVLASVQVWNDEFLADTATPFITEIFRFQDREPFFFFLKRHDGSDTCTFHKAIIHEDLGLTFEDYDWFGSDFYEVNGHLMNKTVNVIVGKEGEAVLSYNTENMCIKTVKFDDTGHVYDAVSLIDTYPDLLSGHGLVTTPDSLGCRIIRQRTDGPYGFSCFTFDADLNLVDTIVNVDQLSYPPVSCSDNAYFRVNRYNGKTYSINKWSVPAYNNNPEIYQDILMSVYDENMVQTHYTWGIHTPTVCQGGLIYTIDFGSSDEVYMAGGMDGAVPHNLYVAYMDQDLNKYGEIYYVHPSKYLIAECLVACPDGGCLVYCDGLDDNTHAAENCIIKITVSDFLNIEEAHSHGFAVATVYPNPGKDVFSIRTFLQNARVEVYDLNGRLIHGQALTEHVTAIDAGGWVEGVYVWKVYAGDPSTGSKSRVETGKWIKE